MTAELNIVAPVAFAVLTFASLWLSVTLANHTPDSGMLIEPQTVKSSPTLS